MRSMTRQSSERITPLQFPRRARRPGSPSSASLAGGAGIEPTAVFDPPCGSLAFPQTEFLVPSLILEMR
jgi:hypothetical protein